MWNEVDICRVTSLPLLCKSRNQIQVVRFGGRYLSSLNYLLVLFTCIFESGSFTEVTFPSSALCSAEQQMTLGIEEQWCLAFLLRWHSCPWKEGESLSDYEQWLNWAWAVVPRAIRILGCTEYLEGQNLKCDGSCLGRWLSSSGLSPKVWVGSCGFHLSPVPLFNSWERRDKYQKWIWVGTDCCYTPGKEKNGAGRSRYLVSLDLVGGGSVIKAEEALRRRVGSATLYRWLLCVSSWYTKPEYTG